MSLKELYPNERVMRRMGAAEIVYDYEIKSNGCVLPFSLLVESKLDLFSDLSVLDRSIRLLRTIHPFLCAKIFVPDNDINSDGKSYFSHDRFFAYADQSVVDSNENVEYLKLEQADGDLKSIKNYWQLLHQREFNVEPVNSKTGPLWRLKIVRLYQDPTSGLFSFYFLLTIHHAITDGRNCYHLMAQLVEMIEAMIKGKLNDVSNLRPFEIGASIEQRLFDNDPVKLNSLKLNEKFEISPTKKIPASFASFGAIQNINDKNHSNNARFVHLNNNPNHQQKKPDLLVQDLIDLKGLTNVHTKFKSFIIEDADFRLLMKKCKKFDAKLTGCLNFLCALATYKTYAKFAQASSLDQNNNILVDVDDEINKKMCFHMLGNLRQFLDIGNLNMGYWSIVLNGIVNIDELNIEKSEEEAKFWSKDFWIWSKKESDSLHARLAENELIENAKLDQFLLKDIDAGVQYEHGGVHFAISNLGNMSLDDSEKDIKFKEFYFNTACVPKRWSAVVFHGLTTINYRLAWGVAYNPDLIRCEIIDDLIGNIQEIVKLVLQQ